MSIDKVKIRSARGRGREEIIELFRTCAAKNAGRAPGKTRFEKLCGITEAEVNRHFWLNGYTELAETAGLQPNKLQERLSDNTVFSDYAAVCLHIGAIPNWRQLQGAQRTLGTRTHSVGERFPGGIDEFQRRFRQWLEEQDSEKNVILDYSKECDTGLQWLADTQPEADE